MKRQSAFIYSLCDNFSNPSCHGFIDKIKIFYTINFIKPVQIIKNIIT